ncbi:MAG: lipopolysaccharide heptosyltransferase II [bacterium]
MRGLPQVKKHINILSRVLDLCGRVCGRTLPAGTQSPPPVIPPGQVRRILLIQLFALGDVLLSLPLVKGLRSRYPHGEIDLWVGKNWQELRSLLPYVDQVISADSRSIGKTFTTLKRLRKKRYDAALVLYPVVIGSWLALLSGARYRIGYPHDFDYRESLAAGADHFLLTHPVELGSTIVHDTQRYLALGSELGLSLPPEPPFLYPPLPIISSMQSFLRQAGFQGDKPLVGMNPNASWQGKQWPSSHFAQLADRLIENQNVQVLFFGSRTETAYIESMTALMKNKPLSAAGKTSLVEAAALIQHCRLFISNDSGPMHMACALDVPVLAIMGPTKIGMFRPWSSISRIVQSSLPCAPCKQENTDLCGHFSCIRSISVDSVYEAAVEMLRNEHR